MFSSWFEYSTLDHGLLGTNERITFTYHLQNTNLKKCICVT